MAGGDEGPWQEISRLAARREGSQPAVTARREKSDKREADVRRQFKVLGVRDVSISRCRQALPRLKSTTQMQLQATATGSGSLIERK
jgi:hypothetical protein